MPVRRGCRRSARSHVRRRPARGAPVPGRPGRASGPRRPGRRPSGPRRRARPAAPARPSRAGREWRRPSPALPSRQGRMPIGAPPKPARPIGENDQVHVEQILYFVLAVVAVVVAVRWLAGRTGLPAAALLTLVGVPSAFLPGPNLTLDSHLVLTCLIPPLLYNAALESLLLDIRRNLRTVISLSVALVLVTAILIGVGFDLWVAGATLAAGVALGAAVAPPDPVAALAVGRKVGLPGNLVTLIQGEGLLNDATALTLLTVAVSAAGGKDFSIWKAGGEFLLSAAGGVVVGVAIAYLIRLLRRLRTDPISANAISLGTPFAAYLLGERLQVSGVLAVVVAGLFIGHDAPKMVTGASRLQSGAVWRLVDFLLEGVVFLLIGQQMPEVVAALSRYRTSTIVIAVAVSVGGGPALRPVWLILTQRLPRSLHTRLGGSDDRSGTALSGREVTALSWAGTRG